MFCKQCGAEINEGAKFCSKCGAVIAPIQDPFGQEKSGKKRLLIGVALAVLAVSSLTVMLVIYFTSAGYRGGKCMKEAEKYMREEAFQEAITSYKEALEYLPESTAAREGLEEAYLEMAHSLYQEELYDEAMEVYETLKKLNPERHEIYLGESDIYLQSDDVITALDVLETGKTFIDGNALLVREEYIKEHTIAYLTHKFLYGSEYEYEYEYDEEGNLAKEISYGSDESGSWREEYEYDVAGNQTKHIRRDRDGSVWQNENEYDASGNLIKNIYYNSDGSVGGWTEYEYDTADNQTKVINYDSNGNVSGWSKSEYDVTGNQIKSIYYNGDGSVNLWSEDEYDATGNLIKSIYYNGDGSVWLWSEYEYDTAGNRIKYIYYDSDGSVREWTGYEYDAGGNQIKSIYYDSDGNVSGWTEYEHDTAGNQIKSIYYDRDGSVSGWTEYEFSIGGIEMADTGKFLIKGIDSYCIKITDFDANGNTKEVSLECDIVYHFSE